MVVFRFGFGETAPNWGEGGGGRAVCHEVLNGAWINLLQEPKIDTKFGTWNVRSWVSSIKNNSKSSRKA